MLKGMTLRFNPTSFVWGLVIGIVGLLGLSIVAQVCTERLAEAGQDDIRVFNPSPGYVLVHWTRLADAMDRDPFWHEPVKAFTREWYAVPTSRAFWDNFYEEHVQGHIYREACLKAHKNCDIGRCADGLGYCNSLLWAHRAVADGMWLIHPGLAIGYGTGVSGGYKDNVWFNSVATYEDGRLAFWLIMPDTGERVIVDGIDLPAGWGVFQAWEGWDLAFVLY